MRKSSVLFQQNIHRGFKDLWKYKKKRVVEDLGIPPALEHLKHKIVEATDFVKDPPPPKIKISLPEPFNVKERDEPTLHPLWHDTPILHFDRRTKLIEGLPQIQVLTKSVLQNGLPQSVENLMGKMDFPNQDELVKRKIVESFIWDATQEKLPKRLDVTRPGHRFSREYGIPHHRKVWNLQNQLLQICALATSKDCAYLPRSKIVKPEAHVFIEKEKENYLYSIKSDYSIMSRQPLEPFGLAEETEDMQLPDIFPLHHTIDIKKSNIYNDEEINIISSECRNPFIHTIGISHDIIFYWHQPQRLVRGIATCFAFAAAQAHQLYGRGIRHLPKPISLHGICSDDKHFSVICFQLNTLNLDGTEGLKNQIWLDGPHQLFESCKDNEVVNYNPEVIRKLIAAYANGLQ